MADNRIRKKLGDNISYYYYKDEFKKGPLVYLVVCSHDGGVTNRYVGSTDDVERRTREHSQTDLQDEFETSRNVEVRVIRKCESIIEALYYEKLYIRAMSEISKNSVIDLNKLVRHTKYAVDVYGKNGVLNKTNFM